MYRATETCFGMFLSENSLKIDAVALRKCNYHLIKDLIRHVYLFCYTEISQEAKLEAQR